MAIQSKLVKKTLIIGGVLGAVQLAAILLMSQGGSATAAKSPQEAIDAAVKGIKNLSPERKEMMKIQIALADYMGKNQGQPPESLMKLIPEYFTAIPVDPSTNKPFKYTKDGTRYFLGDKPQNTTSKDKSGTQAGGAVPSGQATLSPKELDAARDELLSVLTQDDSQKNPAYDPSGKRDPFKPFEIAPKDSNVAAATPLEGQPVEKFSYSAYVESDSGPKGILETPEGRGYTVTKGTKIGLNKGAITDIFPDRIVIVETQTDFTGQEQSKTIEIPIGVKRDSGAAMGGTRSRGQ